MQSAFGKKMVHYVKFKRRPSILSWDEMRDILKNKYAQNHCMNDLLDQFLNLRQNISLVVDSSQFESLKLRCEVNEEQRLLESRFVNGLRANIKLDLKL